MTIERMLKLLLLEEYNASEQEDGHFLEGINSAEFEKDLLSLRNEFFKPYVIDNAPNGD